MAITVRENDVMGRLEVRPHKQESKQRSQYIHYKGVLRS